MCNKKNSWTKHLDNLLIGSIDVLRLALPWFETCLNCVCQKNCRVCFLQDKKSFARIEWRRCFKAKIEVVGDLLKKNEKLNLYQFIFARVRELFELRWSEWKKLERKKSEMGNQKDFQRLQVIVGIMIMAIHVGSVQGKTKAVELFSYSVGKTK